MKSTIETSQYLSSFINSSFFLITNLIVGWGTYPAVIQTVPVLIGHNILDTLLGQYWKNNKAYLFHHILALGLCAYLYSIETLSPGVSDMVWWFSFAEINPFINSLRHFFKETPLSSSLDIIFALSFLIVRPLSSYKSFDSAYNSPPDDFKYLFPAWCVYTTLNLYWCMCLFMYSKRIKQSCMDCLKRKKITNKSA